MNKVMKLRYRILALLVLAVVLSAATYGFAAANNVPVGKIGEGSGTISGYTVSSIQYYLKSSDPTEFDHVDLVLRHAVIVFQSTTSAKKFRPARQPTTPQSPIPRKQWGHPLF